MTEDYLREYSPEDAPELIRLWHDTFGDSQHLIKEFLKLLPHMGCGVVAVSKGEIAGASYVVDAMELVKPGETPKKCGYIYAVAVDVRFRGRELGKKLSIAAAEFARARGAELVCTLPAEESLYGWYRGLIDAECALYRKKSELKSEKLKNVSELSVTEYLRRREILLNGRPHLRPLKYAAEFQHILCSEYGGGFFKVENGIAAAYVDEGVCRIFELICPENEKHDAAASVGYRLKTETTVYLEPSMDGEKYIASDTGDIPTDCVWNFSFD